MATDKTLISKAFRLWYQPGDVFEVRVLDATSADWHRPHMESGYFDYDHIDDAATAIARLHSYRGAYATVNPVNPDLLARSCNRLQGITRQSTTGDGDIVSRRWLLIDCDPKRVSGVSSSEEEHAASLAVANKIRDGLTASGWPAPIMIDSGNGTQMMYRIDQPADDGGLVQRCIAGIATASDDQVSVDLSVFNPARIWRIPGTMNRKGDDVQTRPHRMANFIDVPEEISVVTTEQLEFAATWQAPSQQAIKDDIERDEGSGFDLDEWIAKFAPDAEEPREYHGGRRWKLKVCPFNPAHRNSAAIFQFPDGKPGFDCRHNSCGENDWYKFRELREPGCYDKRIVEYPEVDISGILAQRPKSEKAAADAKTDLILNIAPCPPELYRVPGFVHDVMKFCLDTAPSPQPELAFAGALALQGHLAGRKVECMDGIRTNTYIIMLAPSGSGKNHPRRIIRKVLSRIGLSDEVFEDTSSGQGIEDYLIAKPRLIWLSDEIYEMLQAVINDKSGNKEKIMKMLLTLHTSAADEYTTRVKAGANGTVIDCPHLTLLGACTPEGFFKSINDHIIGHGLFARMELMPCENIPEPRMPNAINQIPAEIEHHALQWKNYFPAGSGNINLNAKIVPVPPEVMSLLREYQLEAHRERMKLKKGGAPEWQQTLWNRAFEGIIRFALIYACSEAKTPDDTTLSVEGVKWARTLVHWDVNNKIAMVKKYFYKTDFERNSEQVVDMMQRWHENKGWDTPMPGWLFNRKTKELMPKVKDAVIQSLRSQERLEVTSTQTLGRPCLTYRLCH